MRRLFAFPLAAAVAAAGIAFALRSPSERESDGMPVLVGAGALVARGAAGNLTWEVHARPSDAGLCIEVRDSEGGRSLGCGFGVPDLHPVGFLIHRTRDGRQLLLAGPIASRAATLRLELVGGERLNGAPFPREVVPGARVFVADLTGRPSILSVEAFDGSGVTLGRRGVDPRPAGDPRLSDH